MNKQKSLLTCTLALGLLLGLGTNAQAEEWEQTFTVDLRIFSDDTPVLEEAKWGFSKDSLVEGYSDGTYTYWSVNQFCVCDVLFGSCNNVLSHYEFSKYDQHFWNVISKAGLKEGSALDLTDTATNIIVIIKSIFKFALDKSPKDQIIAADKDTSDE